jgi:hypothetical protein
MTPPLLSNSDPNQSSRRATLAPSTPVEQLGEAIAEMAARLTAATYELLVMLREFDAQAGWNNGFLSCAHWLHWRTGIDLGAAREKVRVARALANLPHLSGAMQRGEISYAKVRGLTRIATPDNEAQLLDVAYAGTAAHVERVVRAWRRCDRVEEARETQRAHLNRSVTTWVDDDGMVVLRARLTPELGAVVQRALEAATERLHQQSRQAATPESIEEEVTAEQRRADALGLLAECALEASLDRGVAADRYQVVLHVDGAATDASTAQTVLELGDGAVRVSAEMSRRLSCDASVVVMREGPEGSRQPGTPLPASSSFGTRRRIRRRARRGRRCNVRAPERAAGRPVAVSVVESRPRSRQRDNRGVLALLGRYTVQPCLRSRRAAWTRAVSGTRSSIVASLLLTALGRDGLVTVAPLSQLY